MYFNRQLRLEIDPAEDYLTSGIDLSARKTREVNDNPYLQKIRKPEESSSKDNPDPYKA